MYQHRFIEEAYKEALKALEKDEVPVGAVIVKDNRIIGRGYNQRIIKNNALYHAEIVAIQNACKNVGNWRLDGSTIYITLEPCLMCVGAILQARISNVIFGALDEKGGAVLSKYTILDDKRLPFRVNYEYLKLEKCSDILTNFFKKKRKNLKS